MEQTVHLDEISCKGGQAISILTDVTSPEQVQDLVKICEEKYGQIDILVNNSGLTAINYPHLFTSFLELELESWDKIIATNLTSLFICGQAVGRHMVRQSIRGRIVNIGSTASFGADRGGANYISAKHGVLGLTRLMALDLGPKNIIVNVIAPGMTGTEGAMPFLSREPRKTGIEKAVPLKRMGKPEEVATAAVFLASDECSYVHGTAIVVDGGFLAHERWD